MATFFLIISAILFILGLWLNSLNKEETPLFYHYPNIKVYAFIGGIITLIIGLIML